MFFKAAIFISLGVIANSLSGLEVAPIFTDNMVLQRNQVNVLWGNVDSAIGEKVSVEVLFNGTKIEAEVNGLTWKADLSPRGAGGPHSISIVSGEKKLVLKNILIGEVWLATGQLSMEKTLHLTENSDAAVQNARNSRIRFVVVPRKAYDMPPKHPGIPYQWREMNPKLARNSSALAYYFAKRLGAELNIPIGIVDCSYGGAPAESWMPLEFFKTEKGWGWLYKRYERALEAFTAEEHRANRDLFLKNRTEFKKKMVEWNAGNQKGERPPPPQMKMGPYHFRAPGALYSTMLKPLAPIGIRGVILAQGESDINRAWVYRRLLPEFISELRNLWERPDLPVYFVQLHGNERFGEKAKDRLAVLRESQSHVSKKVPNTGMVVSVDVASNSQTYAKKKKPIAERLAMLALNDAYGKTEFPTSGPIFKELTISEGKAILSFDFVGEALILKEGTASGFTICGDDQMFVPAEASIEGEHVIVWSDAVKEPVAVRYAWSNIPECSLFDGDGLPASPFRTDSFKVPTQK